MKEHKKRYVFMKKKEMEVKRRISNLKFEILDTIDKMCVESGYTITYVEINAALSEIIKMNLEYEIQELIKDK